MQALGEATSAKSVEITFGAVCADSFVIQHVSLKYMQADKNESSFKRKLSKREKKEQKKKQEKGGDDNKENDVSHG